MNRVWTRVREMVGWQWVDVSRSAFWTYGRSMLRSAWAGANFFRRPSADGTVIDYELARALYRNGDHHYRYGAGFVRPIIDIVVDMVGLPTISGEDGNDEAFLNECVRDYWAPTLQQAMRDAMRDSKTVIRFYQPRIDNPLFVEADREHGGFEVVPPESITISFHPADKNLVTQAVVLHNVQIDERSDEQRLAGEPPVMREHEIVETITPQLFTYYDKANGAVLTSWRAVNNWGFVPVWPIWNEYAADLGGGQSDIEAVMPFIKAFHDVLDQSLAAHEYHSIPKVKFNVKDVANFIANNWPEVVDSDTGKVINGAKIEWRGTEILFFAPEEDAGFIEATSVLGDSKVLLDFLIDCICIASETPRWALLSNDAANANTASMEPFKKKIERKRVQFTELFVMASKMALAANGKLPVTVRLNWAPPLLSDLVSKGQAIQQLILGWDVATAHGWMADSSVVKLLCAIFPEMNAPDVEMALAKANLPAVAPPAPPSATQAIQPPAPSTNGTGSPTQAQQAIATTAASRS